MIGQNSTVGNVGIFRTSARELAKMSWCRCITGLNYAHEGSFLARGYGVAQYFTYSINHWLTAAVRGEVWREESGFFVAHKANGVHFASRH